MENGNIDLKNRIYMIQKQITQPQILNIRILTELYYQIYNKNNQSVKNTQSTLKNTQSTLKHYQSILENKQIKFKRPNLNQQFAEITIYTDKKVYQNILKIKHINQQLTWSNQTILTIQQALIGKRDKIQIIFKLIKQNNIKQSKIQSDLGKFKFQIICQIKSGINLTLFSLQMEPLPLKTPFVHLKHKLRDINRKIQNTVNNYKQEQKKFKQQIKTIECLQKQIKSSSQIQIQYMKSNFLVIINQCKQQIRKYLGNKVPIMGNKVPTMGIIINTNDNNKIQTNKYLIEIAEQIVQNNYPQILKQQNKQTIKIRQILKVDRDAYDKVKLKKMELEQEKKQDKIMILEDNQDLNQKFIIYNRTKEESSSDQEQQAKVEKQREYGNQDEQKYGNQDEQKYGNQDEQKYDNQDEQKYGNQDDQKYDNQEEQNKAEQKQNQPNWDQLFD